MRIWAIISIVFGILCVLGALQQIQPMSAPPPCWICPDGGVDSTAYASSWCRGRRGQPIGGTTCLETDFANTFCGPRSVTDSAGCSSRGGDWIESYCGEVNAFWAGNVRGGSSECAVLQASPQLSACCIPGDPPPSGGNWVALMLFIFNLLLAICKISGGGVLSCCGGQPSEGKMKSAMGFAALSILIEIGVIIVLIVAIGSLSQLNLGGAAERFFTIILILYIIWSILEAVLDAVFICQIKRAKDAGIGCPSSGVPSI
jgi:hypothetical protein